MWKRAPSYSGRATGTQEGARGGVAGRNLWKGELMVNTGKAEAVRRDGLDLLGWKEGTWNSIEEKSQTSQDLGVQLHLELICFPEACLKSKYTKSFA